MTPIKETLFDLLFNALLQIGFFAILAVVFSRLVAKARATHQYYFYLTVLLLCVAAPVINTFWQSPSIAVAEKSQRQVPSDGGGANHFWSWDSHSKPHRQLTIATGFQSCIVSMWGVLVLFRLAR